MVLQRDVPPGQAPYFDGSFQLDTKPEQIVVRAGPDLPDLRGNWLLGVYNNEPTNVAYTIRATTPSTNGLLVSALPIIITLSPMATTNVPNLENVDGQFVNCASTNQVTLPCGNGMLSCVAVVVTPGTLDEHRPPGAQPGQRIRCHRHHRQLAEVLSSV